MVTSENSALCGGSVGRLLVMLPRVTVTTSRSPSHVIRPSNSPVIMERSSPDVDRKVAPSPKTGSGDGLSEERAEHAANVTISRLAARSRIDAMVRVTFGDQFSQHRWDVPV